MRVVHGVFPDTNFGTRVLKRVHKTGSCCPPPRLSVLEKRLLAKTLNPTTLNLPFYDSDDFVIVVQHFACLRALKSQ